MLDVPCVPCVKATDEATLKTSQVSKVLLEMEQHETTRQDSCIRNWNETKKRSDTRGKYRKQVAASM